MAEPIDKDEYHNQEYISDVDLIGRMTKTDESKVTTICFHFKASPQEEESYED